MKMMIFASLLTGPVLGSPQVVFEAETIDDAITVGYGLAIADVDGDGKLDILLADSDRTVAYQAPDWKVRELTGKLTERDHVCLCAKDLDGDKRAEIAVGAGWNPGDTRKSGAVFSLAGSADCFAKRDASALHHEPTVHRMHWVAEEGGKNFLAVLPLHGPGNVGGEGEGINFLGYRPEEDWRTFLIHRGFHLAHNFDPVRWGASESESILVACKEGVHLLQPGGRESWRARQMTEKGAGEVRLGKLPNGKRFITTIEPMHGNEVVINPEAAEGRWSQNRVVLDDSLKQGHALVAGDFLGLGFDQVAAGWRAKAGLEGKVGIRLYLPTKDDGSAWKQHAVIDNNEMACEDMKAADLDGDGDLDLVAAGRATRNVVIYWNRTKSE